MGLFDKLFKRNNKVGESSLKYKYKPIPKTPELLERAYEEECYKKYGIEKHHKFTTK